MIVNTNICILFQREYQNLRFVFIYMPDRLTFIFTMFQHQKSKVIPWNALEAEEVTPNVKHRKILIRLNQYLLHRGQMQRMEGMASDNNRFDFGFYFKSY